LRLKSIQIAIDRYSLQPEVAGPGISFGMYHDQPKYVHGSTRTDPRTVVVRVANYPDHLTNTLVRGLLFRDQ